MAPSTSGTFLRSFTFGHIRQLDKMVAEAIRRAWAAGARPGDGPLVVDLDSTVCEVHGKKKHGAAYGYTRVLGYHPLLATPADTGEVLHARIRKGSSQRCHKRFVEELIARVRRAGAAGALCLRADSGFWSHELIDTLGRLNVGWSITVTINKAIRRVICAIDDGAWTPIVYPDGGEAAVAVATYICGRGRQQRSYRLIVRRTRLSDPAQLALWPDWRYHAFVTSSPARWWRGRGGTGLRRTRQRSCPHRPASAAWRTAAEHPRRQPDTQESPAQRARNHPTRHTATTHRNISRPYRPEADRWIEALGDSHTCSAWWILRVCHGFLAEGCGRAGQFFDIV